MTRAVAVVLGAALLAPLGCRDDAKDAPVVTVCAAASAGPALRAVGARFVDRGGAREVRVELSGSRAVVHKLTEQGRVPDLLVSADERLLRPLAERGLVGDVRAFARNELVLAYNPRTAGGKRLLAGEAWQRVLARDDVRVGIANPALAPVGVRALLALQLNDKTAPPALRTGAAIAARTGRRDMRPDVAKLLAPLEAGELDAAFVYLSEAHNAELAYVELPPEVSFADPALAPLYATASEDPDGEGPEPAVRGAPAVYGLAIPKAAPNPEAAAAFVALLLSAEGRATAGEHGLQIQPPAP